MERRRKGKQVVANDGERIDTGTVRKTCLSSRVMIITKIKDKDPSRNSSNSSTSLVEMKRGNVKEEEDDGVLVDALNSLKTLHQRFFYSQCKVVRLLLHPSTT